MAKERVQPSIEALKRSAPRQTHVAKKAKVQRQPTEEAIKAVCGPFSAKNAGQVKAVR